MFLWRTDGEIWVTHQTDHMVQVEAIGRAWGNDRFPSAAHPGTLLAARLHDEGWREIDHAFEFDHETGLPIELTGKVFGSVFGSSSMPASHYAIGVELLLRHDPYAALIASLHGTGVYLRDYGIDGQELPARDTLKPSALAFLEAQEELQTKLRRDTNASESDVWHDFRLLIAWNRLSQIFTRGLTNAPLSKVPTRNSTEGEDVRVVRIDKMTVAVDPYPFTVEPALFPVWMYRMPDRRFDSAQAFADAKATQPPFTAVFQAVTGHRP